MFKLSLSPASMNSFKHYIAVLALLCLGSNFLTAQNYFVIDDIKIEGNKRTRDYVIKKELDFEIGDTIFLETLVKRMESNQNRLQNTRLFTQVVINTSNWRPEEKKSEISINLVENWFWYPMPIFELGDRSFNEWFYQHNASVKRLNLGIRFLHINLTGNKDQLKLVYNTGFTQKYELDYNFPYLNNSNTVGANFNVMYVTHKEIAYETKNNKLQFVNLEDELLLSRFRTRLGLHYRPGQRYSHSFLFEYYQNTIHDTITNYLNPDYFDTGKNSSRHFSFNYHFLYSNVNLNIYPTRGNRLSMDLRKDGIGFGDIDLFQFTAAYEHNFKLHQDYTFSVIFKVKKTLLGAKNTPYFYQTGLGYREDVMSGYQLYVIDGVNYAYIKTMQKLKLLDRNYNFKNYMPFKQFRLMPLELYVAFHGDLAYVEARRFYDSNPFSNRLIYGLGISLDLVAYYNYVFSLEFSVNHTGEPGIFLSGSNTFE